MARMRTQPQGAVYIDWSNPITQGLVFAYSHTPSGAVGFGANGNNQQGYVGATAVSTPLGVAAKSNSTTSRAYSISGQHGLITTNYSLFALCTAASTAVTQNVIDMDNSSPRYFQLRLANGKADFIPFNTSAAVTGQATAATALSVAELNRGFTIGATASPTRTAVFQNSQMASAAPTSLIAPSTGLPISIGVRATGTMGGWTSGAISLVAGWNRTLSDAEMLSLAANPWQLFWTEDDYDPILASNQSYAYNASGGFTTLGTAAEVFNKNYLANGGISLAGSASVTSGSGTQSKTVVGSGGATFSGTSPTTKGAIRSGSGGATFSGTGSVIINGGTAPTIRYFKRSRRPRMKSN